jgi:NDP-sugar pyrophosphorylase family protein
VPIVDADRRFYGVHLFHEMLGRVARPNLVVILAGGRGTRLMPLTDTVPKPMVMVAGRPLLERIVTHLVGFGLTRMVLSVGYLGEQIAEHFGDGSDHGCKVSYLWEDPESPLGSGGPLSLLRELPGTIDDPVLVMNGDLVTNFRVDGLLDHHAAAGSAITMAVRPYTHQVPYGVIRVDADGNLTQLEEKPTLACSISAGIYVLSPDVLDRVPAGSYFPMTKLIEGYIASGGGVAAWQCDQEWEDIGQPHELARARGEL